MDFSGFFSQGISSKFAWISESPYIVHPMKKSPIEAQQRYFSYRPIYWWRSYRRTLWCLCLYGYRAMLCKLGYCTDVAVWNCVPDHFAGAANLSEKVSRDMGYRSDSMETSRDIGPLRSVNGGSRRRFEFYNSSEIKTHQQEPHLMKNMGQFKSRGIQGIPGDSVGIPVACFHATHAASPILRLAWYLPAVPRQWCSLVDCTWRSLAATRQQCCHTWNAPHTLRIRYMESNPW